MNAFFAPQYLGGSDCPTYVGMTMNEVAGSLTKYVHVITFAQKILENQDATSNLTASNIIATMRRILTQDMERVGGRPLMASPFVVWIRGVACPETADTNVLNVKLRDIATSRLRPHLLFIIARPRS